LTNSFAIVDVDITATGTYISKAMPSGFTTSNSVILSTSYFNTNNNLWYFNSLDSVAVTIQGSGSSSQVAVYTTLTSVIKVKVILYKYV